MKVKELIAKLQKLDPEKPVYKQFFDGRESETQEIDEVYESSVSEYSGYIKTKTTLAVMIS